MNEYHKISEGILGEETIEKTNTELFLSLVGQYFPEAIKDGEVDFTALKEEMGEFHEVGSEHYDFTWAGKQSAKKEAQSDIFGKTLKYKPQDSLNPDTTENIYIEGDNLEALKLLRRNYHGKIKMIYIDPPYNTGNDFVYHDNFAMTEEELANLSGDIENGVRLKKNPKDNARYHTNWLNMMYPRLKVARDLLADDGVVFISIDENEVENLRKICDEVFGESNFIAQFIWRGGRRNLAKIVSTSHEYIMCFAKNLHFCSSEKITWKEKKKGLSEIYKKADQFVTECNKDYELASKKLREWFKMLPEDDESKDNSQYCYIDEKGVYFPSDISSSGGRGLDWKITNPFTGNYVKNPTRGWCYSKKEDLESDILQNNIHFNGDGVPCKKRYLRDNETQILETVFYKDRRGSSNRLKKLFDNKDIFPFPKDEEIIKHYIESFTDSNSIILDFFSGSATTAHAVMQLNAEDGGNRKFIMVQLPEETDEKSEAYKAGYKNICEIGKERIRRAAKKIHEDNPDAKFDDGFKVFKVADTNIRWNTTNDEEIKLLADNDYSTGDKDNIDFTPGHNDIDIVYEIMLRQFDIPLSTPIEKLPEVSDRTYIFANAVVVCLEPEIDEKLIEKLASIEPVPGKFVLRDSAFNDDIELKDVSYRRLSALIANHQLEGERKNRRNNYTVEFI